MKRFKVVAIPDETRIIINIGEQDGYNDSKLLGRYVEISEPGIEIIDPDTKKHLGQYNPIKEKLRITNVYESYSIARKPFYRSKLSSSPMAREADNKHFDTISVNSDDLSNIKLKSDKVSIGDIVKLI
ncbi:hypothetical protein [Listeria grayi]|uniref:hypothetical protein n=1 Tax=Listeria grayi TaxID=1641 RepID=UPI0016285D02|nr:hypothetical protein [Listeria grayi]MBC1923107.1 hypothetical protein [Listeria grayi]